MKGLAAVNVHNQTQHLWGSQQCRLHIQTNAYIGSTNVRKQTQAGKEKTARTLGSLQTTHRGVAAQKQDDCWSDAPLGFTQ